MAQKLLISSIFKKNTTTGEALLRPRIFLCAFSVFVSQSLQSAPAVNQGIFDFSLEELRQIQVKTPGVLTRLSSSQTPASVTTITADDIRRSAARNIYDLLEQYAPGVFWMNHEEGPHLGTRGNIVNRNYNYLLLVNNRVLNNKGYFGAKSELEHWDLGDIQKIEFIRGPGSVTYGAGAVAGVISITTNEASAMPGLRVSGQYVDDYDSKGISISYGSHSKHFDIYAYGSVTETTGTASKQFQVNGDNSAGFVGVDIDMDTPTMTYFADADEQPQLKLHLDISFLQNWRWWTRLTQQGSTWRGNETQTLVGNQWVNLQHTQDRQFTSTLTYDRELAEDFIVSAMASFDSFDTERRISKANQPDIENHPLNKRIDFAENELLLKAVVNWKAKDWLELAVGAEYSWDRFGHGWNDSRHDMRLGEGGTIVSGPNSRAIEDGNRGSADRKGNHIYAGNGWDTETFSVYSEANIDINKNLKTLISARVDKNTYTDALISPRIALISPLAKGHQVKFVAQRSVRMNTAGQLFAENEFGASSDPETLDSFELIYSGELSERASLEIATFLNQVEVLGWEGDSNQTLFVGNLDVLGFEAELEYQGVSGSWGLNYSYSKQQRWQLADGLSGSGISYSSYSEEVGGGIQVGEGNDLNNWPNQGLKLFGHYRISSNLVVSGSLRYLWDFQGAKDGLIGLEKAVAGSDDEAAVSDSLGIVKNQGAYDSDLRIDASLSYALSHELSATVFVQNLYGSNDNKRYSYDSGNDDTAPRRVRFVEEPRMVGLKLDYQF